jgi:hypothetical protein
MVDKEKLLEEAKLRYPIGCKIKSALEGDKHPIIVKVDRIGAIDKINERFIIWNVQDNSYIGFLYDDGKWAEVVEYPKDYKPYSEMILNKLELW